MLGTGCRIVSLPALQPGLKWDRSSGSLFRFFLIPACISVSQSKESRAGVPGPESSQLSLRFQLTPATIPFDARDPVTMSPFRVQTSASGSVACCHHLPRKYSSSAL
ncbi:hypothetical protein SKAU_G00023190 [Synaphobranchus kaupii]|uniref:Uncharacterized protein n=1 Tax=Synaphobranchus kaupii TaxID=118154 RepID=A0A9Q1GC73_SYNKA|nr:hypothetical protein SKAU_G00023190 [Synaphobranchus kaupii]